ncbi:MAG: hypothetical protein HeimC3_43520 [Candidatus Heimdallarchaeota archaeon LC_3]|nr:MAG: hypothetical protein HeimC3_43520 [Candidatus Heimdallarchaeota archaeon LC_3]
MEKIKLQKEINKYIQQINDKLEDIDKTEKTIYLHELEYYLLDSYSNRFSNNFSEKNVETFIESQESPETVANDFINSLEKSELAPKTKIILENVVKYYQDKLQSNLYLTTVLMGIILGLGTLLIYNITLRQFRPLIAFLLIITIFYIGYSNLKQLNSDNRFKGLIGTQLLFITIGIIFLLFEFRFVYTTGKFLVQFVDGVYQPLEYSSTYFSSLYHSPYELDFIYYFHKNYILIYIISVFLFSFFILIIHKVALLIFKTRWKTNVKNILLVALVVGSIGFFGLVNDSIDYRSMHPVQKIGGDFYVYGDGFEDSIREIEPQHVHIGDERIQTVVLENISVLFDRTYLVNIQSVFAIGYDSYPLFQATEIENGSTEITEFRNFGQDPNYELPENFPDMFVINLSLEINSSVRENYQYYYFQNDTNTISIYQYPYYFVREIFTDRIVEKAYDVIREEVVYYGFNKTNVDDQNDPLNAFQLIRTDLYRTLNNKELIDQFTTNLTILMLAFFILSSSLLLINKKRIK